METKMQLYTCTIANRYFWENIGTMAQTPEQAEAQIAAYLASEDIKKSEAEERGMWLEEFGPYPGDEAYTYEAGDIKEDADLDYCSEEYRQKVMADTAGNVWHIDSGGNG
jgi:hypothetical protein